MIDKKVSRQRRAKRARMRIREQGVTRWCVSRRPRHIYAQMMTGDGDTGVASASTLEKDLRSGSTGNIDAASVVGKLVAERAVAAGVTSVAFDRNGFKYHGRVKALADAAREAGLEF